MAAVRDPEATKARIFAAATAEFAAHGIAGARVDRIAREAKANKQLIYAYFGDKAELFAQVLEHALLELASAVPVDADDPDCYVDRLMAYHRANPELVRLLLWEGLEYGNGEIPHEAARRARYDAKAEAFAAAQEKGRVDAALPPRHLLFMLSALAGWATAVPQFRRLLVGGTEDDLAGLRESVRTAAGRITRPAGERESEPEPGAAG
ncbi:TetR family transcriptional regulator [Streptomyces klenkii]|uniref:TetR/AcrR family transcriptional regulator n=1 Tax=Streptomyces klenkii TaxID=1420899 RepID=A0A3B0BQL0_9ACTN|nr:TetR family transcriptional regulator [Streptomyces klenkii]RKN74529.1 TetR/AcrR family transcriptional regulator [Streptomyces klenkii]